MSAARVFLLAVLFCITMACTGLHNLLAIVHIRLPRHWGSFQSLLHACSINKNQLELRTVTAYTCLETCDDLCVVHKKKIPRITVTILFSFMYTKEAKQRNDIMV